MAARLTPIDLVSAGIAVAIMSATLMTQQRRTALFEILEMGSIK
jgi:hypothetical protein